MPGHEIPAPIRQDTVPEQDATLRAVYLGIAAFTAWRQRRSMVAP